MTLHYDPNTRRILDSNGQTVAAINNVAAFDDPALGYKMAAGPELVEALDPDALEDIARDLVGHGFGTTVESLRGIAAKQRAALAKATGETK